MNRQRAWKSDQMFQESHRIPVYIFHGVGREPILSKFLNQLTVAKYDTYFDLPEWQYIGARIAVRDRTVVISIDCIDKIPDVIRAAAKLNGPEDRIRGN